MDSSRPEPDRSQAGCGLPGSVELMDFHASARKFIYAAWRNEIARFFVRRDRGLGVDTSRGRAWSLASGHKGPLATDKRLVCVAFRHCSLSGSGLVVEEIRSD